MKTCLVMITIIKLTQIYAAVIYKIASYVQTAWRFQLIFLIYIFGAMILQIKQKTKFWKIGPCAFNWVGIYPPNKLLCPPSKLFYPKKYGHYSNENGQFRPKVLSNFLYLRGNLLRPPKLDTPEILLSTGQKIMKWTVCTQWGRPKITTQSVHRIH